LVSRRDRRTIARAVDEAERVTGLQLCVYLGPADGDPRRRAEQIFVENGLDSRPAVLVLVAPDQRRVEVLTSQEARGRVDDESCAVAVAEMTQRFAQGDFSGGIVAGVRKLAEAAGPGEAPGGQEELPDVIDG
jgi:uncharacterized membrane protein YgcG